MLEIITLYTSDFWVWLGMTIGICVILLGLLVVIAFMQALAHSFNMALTRKLLNLIREAQKDLSLRGQS